MPVKNVIILCAACTVLIVAMAVGMRSAAPQQIKKIPVESGPAVPSIGKIQVLNGCGAGGAANIVAEFLRVRKFDVKNIGNAPMSNYQTTLIASRTRDMTIARQVAQTLNTDAVLLMRTQDTVYNVTVYVGADYKEHVR
jgi:LytR cell envelope-related transcriptional attenuator